MHTKDSGRFAVDEDLLQFRTAPKMMMDRKRNWAENETDLKRKYRKRNWSETGKFSVSAPKTKTKFGRSLSVSVPYRPTNCGWYTGTWTLTSTSAVLHPLLLKAWSHNYVTLENCADHAAPPIVWTGGTKIDRRAAGADNMKSAHSSKCKAFCVVWSWN